MEVFLQLLIILLFQKKEDFKCDLQLSLVLFAELVQLMTTLQERVVINCSYTT